MGREPHLGNRIGLAKNRQAKLLIFRGHEFRGGFIGFGACDTAPILIAFIQAFQRDRRDLLQRLFNAVAVDVFISLLISFQGKLGVVLVFDDQLVHVARQTHAVGLFGLGARAHLRKGGAGRQQHDCKCCCQDMAEYSFHCVASSQGLERDFQRQTSLELGLGSRYTPRPLKMV
jgi:hypothetical protein